MATRNVLPKPAYDAAPAASISVPQAPPDEHLAVVERLRKLLLLRAINREIEIARRAREEVRS
jgi:hypothetical protein